MSGRSDSHMFLELLWWLQCRMATTKRYTSSMQSLIQMSSWCASRELFCWSMSCKFYFELLTFVRWKFFGREKHVQHILTRYVSPTTVEAVISIGTNQMVKTLHVTVVVKHFLVTFFFISMNKTNDKNEEIEHNERYQLKQFHNRRRSKLKKILLLLHQNDVSSSCHYNSDRSSNSDWHCFDWGC